MIRYVDVSQMSAKANGILNIIPISERSELSVIQAIVVTLENVVLLLKTALDSVKHWVIKREQVTNINI